MVFSVAGSPRFRVYDVDFGFGRPAKVEVVSVSRTSAMSVAEDRSGEGGVEVGIALPPERMERFTRCLADAIAWLSSPERNYRR
uniref:Anthocyanin 5-aromatic acyltransferase n=1 Tax=Leersia perrieri TaxID=77586 RepID=A0A0D9VG16_9ORYZ